MSCSGPIVVQNQSQIQVAQPSDPLKILQVTNMIRVCAQSRVARFAPYTFTATQNGQTTFGPLSSAPVSIITLAITGTLQNPGGASPDYTLDGLNIVLNGGIDAGSTVYGIIQTA